MPAPFLPQQPGAGGALSAIGMIAGPLVMMITVLRQPGPVKTLTRAGALSPESARKATTLGLAEPPLQPLLRAGVVVREADGRIWLDARKARWRQWRIAITIGLAVMVVAAAVGFAMSMGKRGGG
jgi:hypothetical protein